MTDRSGLGIIGLMLGAATLLVMLGSVVVGDHLTGKLHIDDGTNGVTLPSAAR
jgi:hypothetical protein